MKILITGASGYIGRSFISTFEDKYEFIPFSLLTNNVKSIDFHNAHVVLHCAALVHKKIEYPYEKYYEINVEYPVALAKKAKASGVKQFIFISTIAVYGENKQILCENTEYHPVTHYGKSKLEAEQQLQELSDANFVVSIIRPPMVYGKNAPGNIHSLVNLVKKVPFLPLAQIHNNRSFIYIGNLCHLVNMIIEKQKGGVFLASDGEAVSTTRLIELIAEGIGKKIYLLKIPFFESLLNLVKPSFHKRLYGSLVVDDSITRERLALVYPYSLEDGIKLMLSGANE